MLCAVRCRQYIERALLQESGEGGGGSGWRYIETYWYSLPQVEPRPRFGFCARATAVELADVLEPGLEPGEQQSGGRLGACVLVSDSTQRTEPPLVRRAGLAARVLSARLSRLGTCTVSRSGTVYCRTADLEIPFYYVVVLHSSRS